MFQQSFSHLAAGRISCAENQNTFLHCLESIKFLGIIHGRLGHVETPHPSLQKKVRAQASEKEPSQQKRRATVPPRSPAYLRDGATKFQLGNPARSTFFVSES
jgi:hypothetical protein